jgi:hypothetical protein
MIKLIKSDSDRYQPTPPSRLNTLSGVRTTPWWNWPDIIEFDYQHSALRHYMTQAINGMRNVRPKKDQHLAVEC